MRIWLSKMHEIYWIPVEQLCMLTFYFTSTHFTSDHQLGTLY